MITIAPHLHDLLPVQSEAAMTSISAGSPAFTAWLNNCLSSLSLNEQQYYVLTLEAEVLHHQNLITTTEFLAMYNVANQLLLNSDIHGNTKNPGGVLRRG